jgi:hypothetical protein
LPTTVDLELLQRQESEGLLSSLIVQRARLSTYIDKALEQNNPAAAAAIERHVIAKLTLTTQLLGSIVNRTEVRSTSVLISADYLQLRHAIVAALKPFPEAARAVGAALHELETKAATELKANAAAGHPLRLEHKAPHHDAA